MWREQTFFCDLGNWFVTEWHPREMRSRAIMSKFYYRIYQNWLIVLKECLILPLYNMYSFYIKVNGFGHGFHQYYNSLTECIINQYQLCLSNVLQLEFLVISLKSLYKEIKHLHKALIIFDFFLKISSIYNNISVGSNNQSRGISLYPPIYLF